MSQLSEQEKKKKKLTPAEVFYHEQKIGEIEQEFIAFQNELNNKQERVREWAERLDAIKEEKGIQFTDEICVYICKRKFELNVDISDDWVRKSLDPKYKNDSQARPGPRNTSIADSTNVELPNISKIVDRLGLEQAYEQTKKVREFARDLARLAGDVEKEIEDKADRNHFQLPNSKPESKSTPKPDSRVTKMADAFRFGVELFEKLEEKAEEFPSKVDEEEYHAQSVYQYLSIFTPMVDEKWSADWVSPNGWIQIEKQNEIKGKHGGATSKQAEITTISGKVRAMTREQVGDKFEEVADKTCELYNALPGITGIGDWYDKRVRPFIGQRKVDLHDTLSEKA